MHEAKFCECLQSFLAVLLVAVLNEARLLAVQVDQIFEDKGERTLGRLFLRDMYSRGNLDAIGILFE